MKKTTPKTKSSKSRRAPKRDGVMYNAVTGTYYDLKGGKIIGMRPAKN